MACDFIKKEILTEVFSCEFCKIFKNTFFTEQLWTNASEDTDLQKLTPKFRKPEKIINTRKKLSEMIQGTHYVNSTFIKRLYDVVEIIWTFGVQFTSYVNSYVIGNFHLFFDDEIIICDS